MPEYKYRAQDSKGKVIKGKAEAYDETDLQKRFHDAGLLLLDVKPVVKNIALKPLKKTQLADFCRQLGTLTKAGVTLVKALEIVANDEALSPYERQLYIKLRDRVVQGVALSAVMTELERAFPQLLIFMLKAAETSGSLDNTCLRLADQFTKDAQLEQAAKNSLTYPKILAGLIVLVVAILFGYVLPQFEEMFSTMGKLPLPTRKHGRFSLRRILSQNTSILCLPSVRSVIPSIRGTNFTMRRRISGTLPSRSLWNTKSAGRRRFSARRSGRISRRNSVRSSSQTPSLS